MGTFMAIPAQSEQVISMTDLRRRGKELLDRLSSGAQEKYLIKHDGKLVYAILPFGGDLNLNHENLVISATDLQRNGKELLKRLNNSDQKRFLVVRRNRPICVLMPINNECDNTMDIVMYEVEASINKSKPV